MCLLVPGSETLSSSGPFMVGVGVVLASSCQPSGVARRFPVKNPKLQFFINMYISNQVPGPKVSDIRCILYAKVQLGHYDPAVIGINVFLEYEGNWCRAMYH